MPAVRMPAQQRLVLESMSWEGYSRLLREFADRHLRITYDRGLLEIMTLSHRTNTWLPSWVCWSSR